MLPRVNLVRCDDADYLLFSTNDFITNALLQTGNWDINSLIISKVFIAGVDQPLVLDIGANLGAYSVPIGKELQKLNGSLYSFEPQRIVYYQLCGNILLNRLDNVFAFNKAIGDIEGLVEIPSIDYANLWNIGAFSIEKKYREYQGVDSSMKESSEQIPITMLDNLALPKAPCLIKLDVEGYELGVLRGGVNFLKRNLYPPILFEAWNFPWFEKEKMELMDFIAGLGYEIQNINQDDYVAQHSANPIYVEITKQEDGTFDIRRFN
jgi:FkbM family methyltransferase